MKIFYFDGVKCLQVVNFASKLTLFLFDLKVKDVKDLGNYIVFWLRLLYKDDREMTEAIETLFTKSNITCFDKLVDKSIIATLNSTQLSFALDGYRFYDYIDNNILNTIKINTDINFNYILTKQVDRKTIYFYPGEMFKELMLGEKFSCNIS